MVSSMNLLSFLAVLFIISTVAVEEPDNINESVHMSGSACDAMCSFRWCKVTPGNPLAPLQRRILLRDRFVASYPIVCLPGTPNLGEIIKTGQARVRPSSSSGPFTPISRFGHRVRPHFNKKYFMLREVSAFPPIPGKYGLARGQSKGNQEEFVHDLCVVIPILKYRVGGAVVNTRDPKSCISLVTRRPLILVEMTWDAGDDLDLRVTEPNGNEIFFGNKVSPTGGKLLEDTNVGLCGQRVFGREQVRWLQGSAPLTGTYTVRVRHWNRCPSPAPKPKWSLSIIINGKLKEIESGESDLDSNALIYETTFNYAG